MKPERVEAYFKERMPDARNLRMTKFWRQVGGMSRETYFGDFEWAERGEKKSQRFTIRQDHPGGAIVPIPLSFEYQVHQALYGSELPVARAFWFEEDAPWEPDTAGYVRECIPGVTAGIELAGPENAERREKLGYQFAELMARIHTLDWKKAELDEFMEVPKDDRDCALQRLKFWKDIYDQSQIEARPTAAALYAWLRRNAPRQVERISLVWGDVGVGNIIFEGDRITGLTDWEMAHLGDPNKDWASALWRDIELLLPREELFRHYEKVGGLKVNEEAVNYYTVWINNEYATICNHPLARNYIGKKDKDGSIAALALRIVHGCLSSGLETMGY